MAFDSIDDFNPTFKIVFHNYGRVRKRNLELLEEAIELALKANRNSNEERDWQVTFKQGDINRFEGTITPATELEELIDDYKIGAAKHKRHIKYGTLKARTECQVILHDVPDSKIREALKEIHELGWNMGRDITAIFQRSHDTRAVVKIHNNSKLENLDYLEQEYKLGSQERLRHAIDDCKHQIKDLEHPTPKTIVPGGQDAPRGDIKTRFVHGLGSARIQKDHDGYLIHFESAGHKLVTLRNAVESLNKSGRENLSYSEFSLKGTKLSLPKKPVSPWTLALDQMMAQQKTQGPSK